MQVLNGQLVLELKDCSACSYFNPQGKQPKMKWKQCPKCEGTGKRGSGKCRECSPRYYGAQANPGLVRYFDHDDLEACSKCGGNYANRENENLSDNLPSSAWWGIPIEVLGSGNRPMTAAEQLFGAGIYTIIDYGAHKKSTDDEMIEYMRDQLITNKIRVQASKTVRSKDDLTFCSGLAILRADQGFSVVPHWN
jgi:DnaJ-class molecular chaperone